MWSFIVRNQYGRRDMERFSSLIDARVYADILNRLEGRTVYTVEQTPKTRA